jgi:hypothetical protein
MKNEWMVNFTDLGRADYVQNYLDNKFDMSKLRNLSSRELVARMEALKKSIKVLAKTMVAHTSLWLISAEKLKRETSIFEGNGIPFNIIGEDKSWATRVRPRLNLKTQEKCYLFLFAETEKDKTRGDRKWAEKGTTVKRRRQKCETLYCCQISETNISYRKIIENGKVLQNENWSL